jgi:hypothetical protein
VRVSHYLEATVERAVMLEIDTLTERVLYLLGMFVSVTTIDLYFEFEAHVDTFISLLAKEIRSWLVRVVMDNSVCIVLVMVVTVVVVTIPILVVAVVTCVDVIVDTSFTVSFSTPVTGVVIMDISLTTWAFVEVI